MVEQSAELVEPECFIGPYLQNLLVCGQIDIIWEWELVLHLVLHPFGGVSDYVLSLFLIDLAIVVWRQSWSIDEVKDHLVEAVSCLSSLALCAEHESVLILDEVWESEICIHVELNKRILFRTDHDLLS